jgi:hypothetical protein
MRRTCAISQPYSTSSETPVNSSSSVYAYLQIFSTSLVNDRSMPRDRSDVNRSIGKIISNPKTAKIVSESAGATVSASQSWSESTESTSNSAAFLKALVRAEKCLTQSLREFCDASDALRTSQRKSMSCVFANSRTV